MLFRQSKLRVITRNLILQNLNCHGQQGVNTLEPINLYQQMSASYGQSLRPKFESR